MFHTVHLFQRIDSVDYLTIKSILCKLSKEIKCRHFEDEDCPNNLYVFTLYGDHGITIMLRSMRWGTEPSTSQNGVVTTRSGHNYHAIEIRLNPKALIQRREYVKVAKAGDYVDICKKFEEILKPMQERLEMSSVFFPYCLNNINEYQVLRIDYCINIRSMMHEAYMELIRRADIPAWFHQVTELDKRSGRRVAYKNSFYLMTQNHSIGINFYNKEHQMKKEFRDYENLEDANHILRIEIQCLKGKTNSMKHKHGWKYRDLIHFVNEDIARNMIYSYYEKIVGFEDYYTLEEAKRRVLSFETHRSKTRVKIIEVLELVNQKRSIYKARLEYSNELSDKKAVNEFNSVIKKIRKSGINPVTIPVNWGYSHIPNLVEEIDKEFTQLLRVVIN